MTSNSKLQLEQILNFCESKLKSAVRSLARKNGLEARGSRVEG